MSFGLHNENFNLKNNIGILNFELSITSIMFQKIAIICFPLTKKVDSF